MVKENRSIVITGASTGIGEACSLLLAREGFRVFAAVRRPADAERLKATEPRLETLLMDVTNAASVSKAASQVTQVTGGELFALINNAGIAVAGPLECLPIAELEMQLDINVVGPVRVTQEFLPMLRRSRGRIVMMSSVAGRSALPVVGAYSASKFALEAISDTWRVELYKWGIKVILVEPGATRTPIWDKSATLTTGTMDGVAPEKVALYRKLIDVGTTFAKKAGVDGMPVEDVARTVLFALKARNPKARYLLGPRVRQRIILESLPTGLRDWILAKSL
jgi:NAD(P)-dependent dehydrogenase (short-subunit alcohol dehydrogenase family)